jgi:precorrin-6B methylase 2
MGVSWWSRLRSRAGTAARRLVLRPGRRWVVPVGLGKGLWLRVDSTAPLHRYIGSSEMELSKHTRSLIRRGDTCFDVGCYDGYFALVYARLSRAHVYCFESDDRRADQIRDNVFLNSKITDQISLVETYVADSTSTNPRIDSLDDLISRGIIPSPDFIKIDVEGAESAVLSGASRLLRESQPNLVIETHSEQLGGECVALLHAAGYVHRIVKPRKFLREHRGTGHNEWVIATYDDSAS